ncbi:MAG: hypothetical protein AAGA42_10840 [Actinomycetota bacterium]
MSRCPSPPTVHRLTSTSRNRFAALVVGGTLALAATTAIAPAVANAVATEGSVESLGVAADPRLGMSVGTAMFAEQFDERWLGIAEVMGVTEVRGTPCNPPASTCNITDHQVDRLAALNASLAASVQRADEIATTVQAVDPNHPFLAAHDEVMAHVAVIEDVMSRIVAKGPTGQGGWAVLPEYYELEKMGAELDAAMLGLYDASLDPQTGALAALTQFWSVERPVDDITRLGARAAVHDYDDMVQSAYAIGTVGFGYRAFVWSYFNGTQYDADYDWHLAFARNAVTELHEFIKVPYPVAGALHHVGSDAALAAPGRHPAIGEVLTPETEHHVIEPILGELGANYEPVDGQSLAEFAASLDVPLEHPYHDSVIASCRKIQFTGEHGTPPDYALYNSGIWELEADVLYTYGALADTDFMRDLEFFWDDFWEDFEYVGRADCSPDQESTLRQMENELKWQLETSPQTWRVDLSSTDLNDAGWASVVDAESIRGQREGLAGLSIDRSTDDPTMRVEFQNSGQPAYDSLQVVSLGGGEVLYEVSPHEWGEITLAPIAVPDGGIEIHMGYAHVGARNGQDTRARQVLQPNAGHAEIVLELAVAG